MDPLYGTLYRNILTAIATVLPEAIIRASLDILLALDVA